MNKKRKTTLPDRKAFLESGLRFNRGVIKKKTWKEDRATNQMSKKIDAFFEKKAPEGYRVFCSGSHGVWIFFAVYKKIKKNNKNKKFIFKSGEPEIFSEKMYKLMSYVNTPFKKILIIKTVEGIFSFEKKWEKTFSTFRMNGERKNNGANYEIEIDKEPF